MYWNEIADLETLRLDCILYSLQKSHVLQTTYCIPLQKNGSMGRYGKMSGNIFQLSTRNYCWKWLDPLRFAGEHPQVAHPFKLDNVIKGILATPPQSYPPQD